jgi:hypothetical protein
MRLDHRLEDVFYRAKHCSERIFGFGSPYWRQSEAGGRLEDVFDRAKHCLGRIFGFGSPYWRQSEAAKGRQLEHHECGTHLRAKPAANGRCTLHVLSCAAASVVPQPREQSTSYPRRPERRFSQDHNLFTGSIRSARSGDHT